MKATIALCFIVAVAYFIPAAVATHPIIDNGPLNPRCVRPSDCPGDEKSLYYYNTTMGCLEMRLGRECPDNGNYQTRDECLKKCASAPGTQDIRG